MERVVAARKFEGAPTGPVYLVRAKARRGRRKTPTVVRRMCHGWPELARVVLWLEMMGYRCSVSRIN